MWYYILISISYTHTFRIRFHSWKSKKPLLQSMPHPHIFKTWQAPRIFLSFSQLISDTVIRDDENEDETTLKITYFLLCCLERIRIGRFRMILFFYKFQKKHDLLLESLVAHWGRKEGREDSKHFFPFLFLSINLQCYISTSTTLLREREERKPFLLATNAPLKRTDSQSG